MIEFGARLSLKDNMYATLQKNLKLQKQFSEQVDKTSSSIKGLGSQRANPTITANDKASGVIGSIVNTLANVSNTVATPVVKVLDGATNKIDAIEQKIKAIKKTIVSPVVKLKDTATAKVEKLKQSLKAISSRVFAPIVKIKDSASKLLAKIKNTLGGLTKKAFTPVIKLKDMASKMLNSIGQGLKKVGSIVAKATVAIKDGATAGLSKIGGMLKSLAKGVTIAVGIAGAGATALLGGSMSAGASMEQSIGGVETLYGADAGAVLANADKAYKTAGLSANAYMEQVTSFSASLLQSVGGDTAKSAQIADMALIDMADNANKFGTDMGMIQNAYQGFAKQNYTMLDNLKLGYGGTEEEMQRLLKDATKLTGVRYDISNLSDVYSAIHAIQDNMGVTGTTAKEASSTFSGSFASMKASAKNLLANLALGGDITPSMEQLVDTASTFLFNNAIPMIGRIFESLPTAIGVAIEKGAPKIKKLGGTIVTALKDGLKSVLPAEMAELVDPAFSGIGNAISTAIGVAKSGMQGLVPVITTLGTAVQTLFPVIQNTIATFGSIVSQTFPVIASVISVALSATMPIISALANLVQVALPIVSNIVSVVAGTLQSVMPTISAIFSEVGRKIAEIVTGLIVPVAQKIGDIFAKISPIIQSAVEVIASVLSACWGVVAPIIDLAMVCFEALWVVTDPIITALVDGFTWLWDTLEPIFGGLAKGLGAVGDAVGSVAEWIGGGIDTVKGWFGFAYGKNRVPYDNYPAVLHQGEKVLTRTQADQYERVMSTRGVQLNNAIQPVDTKLSSDGSTGNAEQRQEVKEINKAGTTVHIEKLADTVVIEKEADVDKVVEDMVKKFRKLVPNMA